MRVVARNRVTFLLWVCVCAGFFWMLTRWPTKNKEFGKKNEISHDFLASFTATSDITLMLVRRIADSDRDISLSSLSMTLLAISLRQNVPMDLGRHTKLSAARRDAKKICIPKDRA